MRHDLRALQQDLLHLIFPLNYSHNTSHLNERQQEFFELYRQDCRALAEKLFGDDYAPMTIDRQVQELRSCLSEEERIEVLKETLLLCLPKTGYDSRLRQLLLSSAHKLQISKEQFAKHVEESLLDTVEEAEHLQEAPNQPESPPPKWTKRKWIMATAGVLTGAAACSLTAGLAAPFFLPALASAAGLTTGAAAFLAGTGGVALMATVFGVAGAGMAGYKVSRRFASLKDFRFIPLRDREHNRSLRVVIAVSGWLGTREAQNDTPSSAWITAFYEGIDLDIFNSEFHCLGFEETALRNLGTSLSDFLKLTAVTVAAAQVIRFTVTAAASTALMLPVTVLQAGDLIDNPWTLGVDRARKAGKALAEALRRGAQGRRPVTLIGYSLGALVIYSCLEELARIIFQETQGLPRHVISRAGSALDLSDLNSVTSSVAEAEPEPVSLFGLIENVVLMGLPVHVASPSIWCQLRLLVAGRFVHCYSDKDWVLSFLHRSSTVSFNTAVAGLNPISDVPTIESVDVSDLITNHQHYQTQLGKILERINL